MNIIIIFEVQVLSVKEAVLVGSISHHLVVSQTMNIELVCKEWKMRGFGISS